MQPITPEFAQTITEEIKGGARLSHLAAKYGLPHSTVYAILNEQGIQYQELLEVRRLQGNTPYLKKRYGYLKAWYSEQSGDSAQEIPVPEERPRVAPEKLIEELISINLHLGKRPNVADLKKHSRLGYHHYRTVFGSLDKAFKDEQFIAHFKKSEEEQTKQRLVNHLRELGRKQGFAPTKEQLLNDPLYGYMRYFRHFGGLRKALELAGFRLHVDQKTGQRNMIKQVGNSLNLLHYRLKEVKLERNTAEEASILCHKIEGSIKMLDKVICAAQYVHPASNTDGDVETGRAPETASAPSSFNINYKN